MLVLEISTDIKFCVPSFFTRSVSSTLVVGSLPRPTCRSFHFLIDWCILTLTHIRSTLVQISDLQSAIAEYDAGKITKAEFTKVQDKAAEESVKGMELAGMECVTDGEQRVSSFATYPIADTLAGTGLMPGLLPAGQFFAIFDDGHSRQLPGIGPDFKKPFVYQTYAYENLKLSKGYATKPMKQAVIAPSMLYLLYPLKDEDAIKGYTREEFLDDVVNECEKDIR